VSVFDVLFVVQIIFYF